jgi:hypothetical protein
LFFLEVILRGDFLTMTRARLRKLPGLFDFSPDFQPFILNQRKIMKTPIRFQSRLLPRRSYKPQRLNRRRLGITFYPANRCVIKVVGLNAESAPQSDANAVMARTG